MFIRSKASDTGWHLKYNHWINKLEALVYLFIPYVKKVKKKKVTGWINQLAAALWRFWLSGKESSLRMLERWATVHGVAKSQMGLHTHKMPWGWKQTSRCSWGGLGRLHGGVTLLLNTHTFLSSLPNFIRQWCSDFWILNFVLLLCCLVTKSVGLCDPRTSPLRSSVHGISLARIVGWVAISFFRGSSSTQGLNLHLLLGKQILYHWATCKACCENERASKIFCLCQFYLWTLMSTDIYKPGRFLCTENLRSHIWYWICGCG